MARALEERFPHRLRRGVRFEMHWSSWKHHKVSRCVAEVLGRARPPQVLRAREARERRHRRALLALCGAKDADMTNAARATCR